MLGPQAQIAAAFHTRYWSELLRDAQQRLRAGRLPPDRAAALERRVVLLRRAIQLAKLQKLTIARLRADPRHFRRLDLWLTQMEIHVIRRELGMHFSPLIASYADENGVTPRL